MRLARALVPLLVGLAAPARAGDETRYLSKVEVDARVWSPWPSTLHKGWAPIFVELRNSSSEERTVELEATSMDPFTQRVVRTAVRLDPHERGALELLVPLGAAYFNAYQVALECGPENEYFGAVVGGQHTDPAIRQVLHLAAVAPEPGAVERWSAALSTTTTTTVMRRAMATASARTGMPMAATPNDVDVAHSGYEGMPRQHAGYSSLDLVVLDPTDGMPSEAQLAGLVAWVRTGGDLLVTGTRARAEALAAPELAAWMEPRFERTRDQGHEYRCGLGRLFVGDSPGDLETTYVDAVRALLDADAGLTPEQGKWRGDALTPSIPELVRLPYRAFAALLILFGIVIGPVNFFFVTRRKRPALLLVTIPAIALVTTVALLAYGIAFQGIDVKTASYSAAVLDQRAHRSACVEKRLLFAGLAPAAGLAPGAGTVVHDALDPKSRRAWMRRRFDVELEDGALLAGDFLPSRTPVTQVLAVERAERARLDVRRSDGGLVVGNNLGAGVKALIVRDPEGGWHELAGPLAPGASAALRPSDPARAQASEMLARTLPLRSGVPYTHADAVPPGCYLADLDSSPFRDGCGIEAHEKAGAHVVLGVLPLDAELWR